MFYSENPQFFVAVDCIIFGLVEGKLCLLLSKRLFEPEKGKWSVMGGFVQTDESVDDAARRVLRDLTGLEDIYMEQVHTFGALHRDPGERVISVAYYALLGPDEYNLELLEKHNAVWIDLNALPQLGFDHPDMIRKALELLRAKCSHEPIGFNLLPAMFTLSQLQSLYETILGESLDKRNFRKRVAETDCIEKTEFIDKTGSRRGASLYRFNDRAYMSHPKFKI
ncbi:MAG: NUDIX hydrolase [Duncaniella sp.]|uniref:NUDIX hydrolase n=1 Tax=Duncaniella sp. TaxID=2518496 RepID=UPI0023D0285C|nr:NUDIX domain-containing protein [Duncaniella sp.]MDE6090424.1 NUDIX hydrolase [Duncaniella sp.]